MKKILLLYAKENTEKIEINACKLIFNDYIYHVNTIDYIYVPKKQGHNFPVYVQGSGGKTLTLNNVANCLKIGKCETSQRPAEEVKTLY